MSLGWSWEDRFTRVVVLTFQSLSLLGKRCFFDIYTRIASITLCIKLVLILCMQPEFDRDDTVLCALRPPSFVTEISKSSIFGRMRKFRVCFGRISSGNEDQTEIGWLLPAHRSCIRRPCDASCMQEWNRENAMVLHNEPCCCVAASFKHKPMVRYYHPALITGSTVQKTSGTIIGSIRVRTTD